MIDSLDFPPEILINIYEKCSWDFNIRILDAYFSKVYNKYRPKLPIFIRKQEDLNTLNTLNNLTDNDWTQFYITGFVPNSMTNIYSLTISRSADINFPRKEYNKILSENSLNRLTLNLNSITDEDLKICTISPSLQHLDLNVNKISLNLSTPLNLGIPFKSQSLKNLVTLSIVYNYIGDKGVKNLCEALIDSKIIKSINLSINRFGENGAFELGKLLSTNTSLTSLKLDYNGLSHTGAKYIANSLVNNKNLNELSMYDCGTEDIGAADILKSLHENKTLTSLNLGMNRLTHISSNAIREMLVHNKSMLSLHLLINDLGDRGIQNISLGLKQNIELLSLNIIYNKIER